MSASPNTPNMIIDQSLVEHCFIHFYGLDVSNAAVHCAKVRFSPITFRLQEALEGGDLSRAKIEIAMAWHEVRRANGQYEEDKGR